MNRNIYSSNNEDGLLRANGPHRIETADMSFSGVRMPEIAEVSTPIVFGEITLYGNLQLVGENMNSADRLSAPFESSEE